MHPIMLTMKAATYLVSYANNYISSIINKRSAFKELWDSILDRLHNESLLARKKPQSIILFHGAHFLLPPAKEWELIRPTAWREYCDIYFALKKAIYRYNCFFDRHHIKHYTEELHVDKLMICWTLEKKVTKLCVKAGIDANKYIRSYKNRATRYQLRI